MVVFGPTNGAHPPHLPRGTWGGVGGLGGIGHHESSSFAPGRGGGVGWWRGYLVLGPSNWYEVRLGGVE